MQLLEKDLIGQKEFPAISIVDPTHPQYPAFKLDREHMIDLVSQVQSQLHDRYSKQKTEEMMRRLHDTVDENNYTQLSEGLAIYVSPHHARLVQLPFNVTEKVVVDDSFEVRDLVYSVKLNKQFLLVAITKNGVRTSMVYGKIFFPVVFKDMPDNIADVTNNHSLPGWEYLDTKAYNEKNIRNFLRLIDHAVHQALGNSDTPIVFMGDKKFLGYIKAQSANERNTIGVVEGNYEHATSPQLRKLLEPILDKVNQEVEEKSLLSLASAVSKGSYAAGVEEVWRAVTEGQCRLLLVEKDYVQPAYFREDGMSIHVDQLLPGSHRNISDAVDDLIEMVLRSKGDIQFVSNGRLTDFQKIAVVKYY